MTPHRRRVLVSLLLAAGLGLLLVLFRGPIVSWFTGRPPAEESGAPAPAGTASVPCEDLPDEALGSLRTAFVNYEEVRVLLAADRTDGLATAGGRLAGSIATARDRLQDGQAARRHLTEAVEAATRLARAGDLAEARRELPAVSAVLIGLAGCEPRLAQGWHVFECPMVSGFNKWFQRPASIANPYMGEAMPDCGNPSRWREASAPADPHAEPAGDGDVAYWTCPMHPSVRQSGPGQCPICGMDLTPVRTQEIRSGEIVLDPERRQLLGVGTSAVVTRPVETEIRAVGRVAFDETRFEDVTVRYGGFIGRLHVEQAGQAVRRGQTLFTLYSPELYAAQREYLVALASQQAARGTGAPDRADYLVEAARRKLRLWDLSDTQIRGIAERGEPIEQIAVPSPASGYVVEKDVVQGAAVQPGMRLFRIAGLDRVWVEAQVYESELPRVRPGQPATVTLSYLPGQTFHGRVSLILPALDPESRTGQVRIEVANRTAAGGPALKPDMYAEVRLAGPAREALMVPASAVLYTGPRTLVFLDQGEGRFQQREVQLGTRAGEYFEVLSGLREGDRVVTAGNFLLDAEARLRSGGEHTH